MVLNDELDNSALLRLTPSEYLKDGYRDKTGRPWPELQNTFATAVATQLGTTETSPQELAGTLEALRQVLPWHSGPSNERFREACMEALEIVSSLYQQTNNRGIVNWLDRCTFAVREPEDIDAFIDHFVAVVRQYTVLVGIRTA
jgi:hypothetical protein